jgi:hypothetical protein
MADRSPSAAVAVPVVDELSELIAAQADVVRRDQLLARGLSRGRLRWRIANRDWQCIGSTVVVLHNGPLTVEQQRWAGVLLAGSGSALAGRTALQVQGLSSWDDDSVHVLVPHGRRVPPAAGLSLVAHSTRREIDPHPARTLPQTRLERSAIDAASWCLNSRAGCGLLAAVVQQRLSTAPRLLDALRAAEDVRHQRHLRAALQDIEGGAHALSEIDFGRLCRRFALAATVRQQVRHDAGGAKRYVDAELVAADGTRVLVEVDGALHMVADQWQRDQLRANELVIAGRPVLRFSSVLIRTEPAKVADQLRRALEVGCGSGRYDSR